MSIKTTKSFTARMILHAGDHIGQSKTKMEQEAVNELKGNLVDDYTAPVPPSVVRQMKLTTVKYEDSWNDHEGTWMSFIVKGTAPPELANRIKQEYGP